jgi:tRNA(His) 5'-end guanylyltransferase
MSSDSLSKLNYQLKHNIALRRELQFASPNQLADFAHCHSSSTIMSTHTMSELIRRNPEGFANYKMNLDQIRLASEETDALGKYQTKKDQSTFMRLVRMTEALQAGVHMDGLNVKEDERPYLEEMNKLRQKLDQWDYSILMQKKVSAIVCPSAPADPSHVLQEEKKDIIVPSKQWADAFARSDENNKKIAEQSIYDHIQQGEPFEKQVPGHEMPPYLPKGIWTALGDKLVSNERNIRNVSSKQSYTLRLDIRGMSKLKKVLVRKGVFAKGWSVVMAELMRHVAEELGKAYGADYVYTQSDEIVIVVTPTGHDKFEHYFGGKHDKLVSLSAATASALATSYIMRSQCVLDLILITFDCRMGVYDSLRDAFELVLWRAYDCGINGVSDAVYNMDKTKIGLATIPKLELLASQNVLPLPPHQAHGLLYHREIAHAIGYNPQKGQNVDCIRSTLVKVDCNNVIMATKNGLLSSDA